MDRVGSSIPFDQPHLIFRSSADGQPLSQAEWNEVKEEISQLKSLVDSVCILDDDGLPVDEEHA